MWSLEFAEVNISNAFETLTAMNMKDVAPETMQNAELVIPIRSLDYGTYRFTYTARMWDDNPEDPNWTHKFPFQSTTFTYIKIIATPLLAQLQKGTAGLVTRGKGQSLLLEPYRFTMDPDYPDMGVK